MTPNPKSLFHCIDFKKVIKWPLCSEITNLLKISHISNKNQVKR